MPATATAVPAATRITSLRSRQARVADDVRRCEAVVERLRSESSPSRSRSERAMISAVRELVGARARLAQVSRELRQAGA
jgi:hypothetical protein